MSLAPLQELRLIIKKIKGCDVRMRTIGERNFYEYQETCSALGIHPDDVSYLYYVIDDEFKRDKFFKTLHYDQVTEHKTAAVTIEGVMQTILLSPVYSHKSIQDYIYKTVLPRVTTVSGGNTSFTFKDDCPLYPLRRQARWHKWHEDRHFELRDFACFNEVIARRCGIQTFVDEEMTFYALSDIQKRTSSLGSSGLEILTRGRVTKAISDNQYGRRQQKFIDIVGVCKFVMLLAKKDESEAREARQFTFLIMDLVKQLVNAGSCRLTGGYARHVVPGRDFIEACLEILPYESCPDLVELSLNEAYDLYNDWYSRKWGNEPTKLKRIYPYDFVYRFANHFRHLEDRCQASTGETEVCIVGVRKRVS